MNLFCGLKKLVTVNVHSMALHIPASKSNAVKLAVDFLKSGGVIAVPTDTVYGLACDATNSSALNKLYSIKCRSENKPVAICLGQVLEVKSWKNAQKKMRNDIPCCS